MAENSSGPSVRVEREGPIAWLTLDRPEKRNAISVTMARDLHAAMDQVDADPAVRVIVVCGAGPAFCAGFDLGEMTSTASVEETRQTLAADLELVLRFWASPKPTLAAVHGYVLGGGFELAMACDVAVAAEDAVFGEPEPTFGSGCVALLLPWITGPRAAREMLLFGSDRVDAMRALRLGLVNEVVPREELLTTAATMARRSALLDATAVRLTKQALNETDVRRGLLDALWSALETDVEIETTRTEEGLEFLAVLEREGVGSALAWRARRVGIEDPTRP